MPPFSEKCLVVEHEPLIGYGDEPSACAFAIEDAIQLFSVQQPRDNLINPTFPIWLKSFLSNSSMVFQPLSNYGPFFACSQL